MPSAQRTTTFVSARFMSEYLVKEWLRHPHNVKLYGSTCHTRGKNRVTATATTTAEGTTPAETAAAAAAATAATATTSVEEQAAAYRTAKEQYT